MRALDGTQCAYCTGGVLAPDGPTGRRATVRGAKLCRCIIVCIIHVL